MKHALKSIACVLMALTLTFALFGCIAEKNMVTDGIEKFDEVSSNYKIPAKDVQISESSDKKTLNYTYSFDVSAGNSKITLLASADKESKAFKESSVWFVGTGQDTSGSISQATVNEFCEIAKYSILAFTELTEAEADAVIEELKANLPESYNGKTSNTKETDKYHFGFSSSILLTGFTIKNNQAPGNSGEEDVTAKPAQ